MLDITEEHPEFTDDDIVNEVCTFMLAVSLLEFMSRPFSVKRKKR